MTTAPASTTTVERHSFGGHVVIVREGHKTYRMLVSEKKVEGGACHYEAKPSNWRCPLASVQVIRELREGPMLKRLSKIALDAIQAQKS